MTHTAHRKEAGRGASTGPDRPPSASSAARSLARARELHTQIGRFQAVRWPAQLQPRISALATTTLPSGIACLDAQAAASSMPAAMAVSNSNPGCQAAGNSIIPHPI
jgi:hypothetical protein